MGLPVIDNLALQYPADCPPHNLKVVGSNPNPRNQTFLCKIISLRYLFTGISMCHDAFLCITKNSK